MSEEAAELTVEMENLGFDGTGETAETSGETTEKLQEFGEGSEELPPLTYIDFYPQCLGTAIEGKEPQFAEFGSLVEQANQWLNSMPQFSVYKCETVDSRLGLEYKLDADSTLMHKSSNGRSVFLRGLRLWLIPRAELAQPVQQLAYVTVLPDHCSGNLKGFLESLAGTAVSKAVGNVTTPNFDGLNETVTKLNKHLQVKPLPGRILTVETLTFKAQETNTSDALNTEECCWSETGYNSKFFLYALRIFYVLGQPAYETVGIYDEKPETFQNMEGMDLKVKFSTFNAVVAKATEWLRHQEGVRIINIQSINVKLERKYGSGPWVLNTDLPGYTVVYSLTESRYSKVLRIAYIKEQKAEKVTPYSSINITSRLFVPQKIEGRLFESFSKTMLRAIKWLKATRLPVFACETVRFPVNADSDGQGFSENRMDTVVTSVSGQYFITCIRVYFPSLFQEPPEEIETKEEEEGWGYNMCVIS